MDLFFSSLKICPTLSRAHTRRPTILQNMSTNALGCEIRSHTIFLPLCACVCVKSHTKQKVRKKTASQNNEIKNMSVCVYFLHSNSRKTFIFLVSVNSRISYCLHKILCTNIRNEWMNKRTNEMKENHCVFGAYLVNECHEFGALIQLTLKSLYFLI